MKKVRSGVYGLNRLLDGGINQNTITAVIGSSGAGKTTFATYFLKRGLEQGEDAIFITLDEEPKQIINEVVEMGWENIEDYLDEGSMVFVDAGGKQFTDFIRTELVDFVEEWKGYNARIVIDPLTPVLWSVQHKYEQRDLVSLLLRETRKIGTVVCTLEEHSVMGDLSGQDLIIPMYLADNVIHLRYKSHENPERRDMKIIKCRSSRHSHSWHMYKIVKGSGIIVQDASLSGENPPNVVDLNSRLEKALAKIPASRKKKLTPKVSHSIYWTVSLLSMEDMGTLDPDYVIKQILLEYGLMDG